MQFRDLHTIDEFRQVMDLEKLIWGYTDAEDLVTVPIFVITVKRGGILVGAFDDEDRMVGFVYSLPAHKDGRLTQWSHMLGVVPAYRNSGLGFQLKLEQRRRALDFGCALVEWTYDPLQALNAHLNFTKLAVVVGEYAENVYGESSSVLHRGTPTDRFIAQWWVADGTVAARISGAEPAPAAPAADEAPIVNATRRQGGWLACANVDLGRREPRLQVEIPVGFTEMQVEQPGRARDWRDATRAIFQSYFAAGYRAVAFSLEREAGRGRYLLEHREG